jgi:predicted nucleic acid-binding protein
MKLIVSGSIAVLERGYRKKYVTDLRQTYLDLLAAKIWIDKKVLKQSLANLGLLPL